ncbi:MAG: hypothetical protein WCL04_07035 [Verrucomicrobiota bacterium]
MLPALAPKCLVCLASYATAVLGLGIGGRDICGTPDNPGSHGALWFGVAGTMAVGGFLAARWRRKG